MRKILWMILIGLILALWAAYTWITPVRATIDGFVLGSVVPAFNGAFTSLYTAIVTSPFWQSSIAPYDWLFAFCVGCLITGAIFWKGSSLKQKVKHAPKKPYIGGPEYVPPTVIPQAAAPQPVQATTIPTAPTTTSPEPEKEVEAPVQKETAT